MLGDAKHAQALCALLKASAPKIYKGQLAGAKQVLIGHCKQYGAINPLLLARLLDTPQLTATGLRDRLEAWHSHPQRYREMDTVFAPLYVINCSETIWCAEQALQ